MRRISLRKIRKETSKLVRAIRAVWTPEEDAIREDNWLFTHWLLKKQLQEIEDEQFTGEAFMKELADMAIIIVKFYALRGVDPEKAILWRLKARHQGKTKEIRKKYLRMWQEE